MEINRTALAARIEAWLAQEVAAGHLAWGLTKGGELKMTSPGSKLRKLIDDDEDLIERALDLPGLSTKLRRGDALSYRAWSLVAERLGTDGPLPTLAQVLDARRAYWAACDAAHDSRRARDRGTTPKVHTRTPETPQAAPERAVEVWRYVEPVYEQGELVSEGTPYHDLQSYRAQLGWLEVHAELDAPRAQVGEPFERARWAPDLARQGVSVRKLEREAKRLTPPAWMDEAPQWGEEVER
jgi:hypothetical protein